MSENTIDRSEILSKRRLIPKEFCSLGPSICLSFYFSLIKRTFRDGSTLQDKSIKIICVNFSNQMSYVVKIFFIIHQTAIHRFRIAFDVKTFRRFAQKLIKFIQIDSVVSSPCKIVEYRK